MKLKQYIIEGNKYKLSTFTDKSGHTHTILIDDNGDGKTDTVEGHSHKVFQWMIQPASEDKHIHNIKE